MLLSKQLDIASSWMTKADPTDRVHVNKFDNSIALDTRHNNVTLCTVGHAGLMLLDAPSRVRGSAMMLWLIFN